MDWTPIFTGTASIILAAFGVAIGRASIRWSRKHKADELAMIVTNRETREKQDRLDADRDKTILELTYAIVGRPATPWENATPGLRHGMEELSTQLSEHRKQDDIAFRKLTELFEDHLQAGHR